MVKCSRPIAILLATYNGEKFISNQLDSLFTQSCQDFIIYIHDDGSTDFTLSIVQAYCEKYPERIVILPDSTIHRGAKDSFLWLLESVEAQYYMFCDQDDIWLNDKVESSLKKIKSLEKENPDKAVMVHTDLKVVDEFLEEMYPSFWSYAGYNVDLHKRFGYAATNNVFTGCTMILNKNSRDFSLPPHPEAPMHDWWIGLVTAKNGVIGNIKKTTVLYRQHGNNVESIGNNGHFNIRLGKFFHFMDKYSEHRSMLNSLGFSFLQAVKFKILYTMHRAGILKHT